MLCGNVLVKDWWNLIVIYISCELCCDMVADHMSGAKIDIW
jgi:hypothetical protein